MAEDQTEAKAFINTLAGILWRDPTVDMRAAEVDGVITVTLTLRAPQVHNYVDSGRMVRLAAGDSITLRVESVGVTATA